MTNLEKAKSILRGSKYTLVLCNGDKLYTSIKRGVAPMLEFIDNGTDLRGFSAADKVIGKAAAMLFVHAGVVEVYADVISRAAADFLCAKGINFTYNELTDKIINRNGDGICPMEQVTTDINDTDEAIIAIKKRLEELRKG
ncbi:MAG: DUF1893 domain-containing protein [Oscillospiraceae bacterium]|nr:DUF1893 domain-containing protein [Oscillospiraceae bacterium]